MSYDSHASTVVLDSEISTAVLPPSDSSLEENEGFEDESLSGEPDASEFAFGDELYDIDDVVELELFHPDNELPESHSSRGTIPGIIAAVLLHVWLFATFKNYILEEYDTLTALPVAVAMTEVEPEEDEPEKEKEKKFSLANPNDKDHEQNEALNATSTGIAKSKEPQQLSPPDPPMEMIDPDLSRNEVFDIPEGLILDESLVVKGTTGNALIQIEAALDRVTHEIAMNLKDKKVLVIWLIDGSASLKDQRELLAKRFTRIYGELDALEKAGQIPKRDEPLVTGVVSFGQRTKYHTEVPTGKFDEIKAAVENIEFNESGEENIFTAVRQVMQRWSYNYRDRQIMLVTITDESGDDFGQLERAINICRKKRAKAYVVGPAAPFGRRKGYVPYVAPENGQTYQIPVDLGPETARYENVLLPFWFSGPQYNYLSSGYGPYGLSRLVNETGGIYFMTNTLTMKGLTPLGTFESEKLRPFKPDYRYSTPEQYDRDLLNHPLRLAIVNAAKFSRDNKPEKTPLLDIRVTPANYRQTATTAQQTVARSQLMVDTILQAFPKGIERELGKEESPRWRMTFCLTYGRLLALRVRCLEYNSACADLKSNLTPGDVGSTSNHWIFKPSRTINFATSERRAAKTAIALLQKVIDEAPGTPWAVMATRELRHPLGIRVTKRFIPPPTPRQRAANNATPRRRIQLAADPRKQALPRKPTPKPKPPKLPRY